MILRLDEVDSTNEYAKRFIADGYSGDELTVITAQYQTAGKGRRGREWMSLPGTALMFSMLQKPKIDMEQYSELTLVAALAIRDALADFDVECEIKWPNDIIINGKKLCGILTECDTQSGYIIIGAGINLTEEAFPKELADKATSVLIETNDCIDEDNLLDTIIRKYEKYYDIFAADKDMSSLVDEYNEHLVSIDKTVKVLDPKGEFEATSKGIDKDGQLIVIKEDNTEEHIYAGEVSVRGVYGYV